MATVHDITTVALSSFNWIDALLNEGPNWNFLTNDGYTFRSTIYYTFSTASGTESGITATAFNEAQTEATRQILTYAGELTGITFAETTAGYAADIHFAQANLASYGRYTAGLCSTSAGYGSIGSQLTSYSADAYVYLDNRTTTPYYTTNQQPVAGNMGYETLLHEIGHALGLKHPFEAIPENPATLPTAQDTTQNTLMSYTEYPLNHAYSSYSPYDIAALNWLYGTDGLQGSWGVGTNGRYYTGTPADDTFSTDWTPASGYNVVYQGEGGADTLVLSVAKTSITCCTHASRQWLVISTTGGNELYVNPDIETIRFSDGSWSVTSLMELTNSMYGTEAADYLQGTPGDDSIYGFGGNDSISGGGGHDTIDGGDGIDLVIVTTARSSSTLSISGSGSTSIVTGGSSCTLTQVERIKFSDTMLALDTSGNAGKVYRLYQAAFDRVPDAPGLGFWIHAVDSGANLVGDVAADFINSVEFSTLYGATPTDADFIALLYTNVLHRPLDQEGYTFWVGKLADGAGRADVLFGFSESTENQANVASGVANGILYQEWII
jgi:hypothetical protein